MDEKESILNVIKKSGYPLEIKTTEILGKYKWTVNNQSIYFDEDEKKFRTIDIKAFKLIQINKPSYYNKLHFEILIECKVGKSRNKKDKEGDNPWVFYVREKSKHHILENDFVSPLYFLKFKSYPSEVDTKLIESFKDTLIHFKQEKDFAVIGIEPFNQRSNQEPQIFKAKLQITKALAYEEKTMSNIISKAGEILSDFSVFSIIYPIIVFDGKLYKYYGKDNLEETDYVQYLVEYYRDIEFLKTSYALIDIVKIDYLEEFLKKIDGEIEALKEKIIEVSSLTPKSF